MNRILPTLWLLAAMPLVVAQPPEPPPEQLPDYKGNGSGLILSEAIENRILEGRSNGSRIVYVSYALSATSNRKEYLFIDLGISYPKHWEGVSHYRLIARKKKGENWGSCDILVPTSDSDINISSMGVGPKMVEDENIEKNSIKW